MSKSFGAAGLARYETVVPDGNTQCADDDLDCEGFAGGPVRGAVGSFGTTEPEHLALPLTPCSMICARMFGDGFCRHRNCGPGAPRLHVC